MAEGPTAGVTSTTIVSEKSVGYLRIPADLARVEDVRAFIDASGVGDILSPQRVFDLKVAASEACANAIEHANSDVRILLWQLSDHVVIEISNVGRFVPRSSVSRPDAQQGRGLGLGLMMALADEIRFSTKRHGRTTIWMTFDHGGPDETDRPEE